jgi:glycerol uptake facilitator-like aquaporin/quercetin dioxygenase-like cupin family protein
VAAAVSLSRRAASEGLGTALLLATVVGSGIMAENLAGGSVALALLANSLATGAGLVALILTFGPVSGAHFNPAVTLADASQGGLPWREVPAYLVAQLAGAFAGVGIANLMFDKPAFLASAHERSGAGHLLGEFVATFGLLSVIWGCARRRPSAVPFAVGAYITAAYWFTSSTSFANPAVTLARAASDTFAGIRPIDTPGFIVAQLLGAVAATATFGWLVPAHRATSDTAQRIAFDKMPWTTAPSGVRSKVHESGAHRLRLLEFTPDLKHPHWCQTGHLGYVLEGEMEVAFDGGTIAFQAGDGVAIPAGQAAKHRPFARTDRVRMIFLEENES